jgi:pSer/pThr/pTyr-binding forkhead associated (FHA) protein
MKKKPGDAATVGADASKGTDPVTEDVRAARLAPVDAVTALRVVGKELELGLPLAKASFTMGRAAASEVDLSLPGGDVSRLHCVLRRNGSELIVTDAGSTNGVVVRGRGGPGSVRAGDRFVVGSTELIALDDAMQALRPVLLRHLGFQAHIAVDGVLTMLARLEDKPLLITAPRGSESEMLAHAIHAASGRRRRRFEAVAVATVAERELTGVLKAASGGTVYVDLTGVGAGRAPASLVNALLAGTYRVRPILVAADALAAQAAIAPAVLTWELIGIPSVATRAADIPHLLNAMMLELGSQRRVEELDAERVTALSEYGWPENHHDLRRAAVRVRALLEHRTVSAAARSLDPPVTPASLTEYLVRIGAIEGKRR